MPTTIENKKRQAIPIQYTEPISGQLKLYILKDREVKVFENDEISQDILDKEAAGFIFKTAVVEEEPLPGV